jgi:hypothetical protein
MMKRALQLLVLQIIKEMRSMAPQVFVQLEMSVRQQSVRLILYNRCYIPAALPSQLELSFRPWRTTQPLRNPRGVWSLKTC